MITCSDVVHKTLVVNMCSASDAYSHRALELTLFSIGKVLHCGPQQMSHLLTSKTLVLLSNNNNNKSACLLRSKTLLLFRNS